MRSCPYPGGLLPTLNSTTKCWQGEVLSSACHEQAEGRVSEFNTKEVNIMYAKPEIAVLGDASSVILGNKVGQTDAIQPLSRRNPTDTELDD